MKVNSPILNNGEPQLMGKLSEKIAVVTGSSSGIGREIALGFAREGATVVITSCSSVLEGQEVVDQIKQMGSNAKYYQADLCNRDEVSKFFDKIKADFGHIDVLVNNAGRTFSFEIQKITEETITRDLRTNYLSAVYCSQEAIKLMKSGHIINTASIRGIGTAGRKGLIGYGGAKAALIHFTQVLANELAPNIFVNAVAPGLIMTDALSRTDPVLVEKWKRNIPIGRFIQPKELVEVYLLLATSTIFTGSILIPDGGYTMVEK